MAELCTRKKCVAEIEDIVMSANERIVLVSPYIDADEGILEWLKRKPMDVDVVVIYGKKKHQSGMKDLSEVKGVTKIFVNELHAKCFLNERKALVTSMNLYQYSQKNNVEIGILVTREADGELYNDVVKLVEHWESVGKKQYISLKSLMEPERKVPERSTQPSGWWGQSAMEPEPTKATRSKAASKTQSKKVSAPTDGFCIRCGDDTDIYATDLKPYCLSCYKLWKKAKKSDTNPEKHCHICGKDYKTSLKRPACSQCYKEYKDVVKFKAA